MSLEELKKKNRLIDLFIELAEIPSPSSKEGELSERIMEILNIHNINAQYDKFGNIIAKIPPSPDNKSAKPILLSAHMDVVGGSEPVNIRLSRNGKFIETDKTRTLGADNKAGVAAILDLAIELNSLDSKIPHGPVEITFTKDEEMGMTGIRNLDTSKIKSQYALIADGEHLGEYDCEGAGFANIYITVTGGKGGHSGINIADTSRVNAIKVLSELDTVIPQGVYKSDPERGVLTSINAGVSIGGSASISISEMIKDAFKQAKKCKTLSEYYEEHKIFDNIARKSALNIINTDARQTYSVRSSDPESEQELISLIKSKVQDLNKKYSGKIRIEMETKIHLKPFIRSEDRLLDTVVVKAGEKFNLNVKPGSFHAGAETHILANEKTNAESKPFIPAIIGLANLENIHSADEKLDWNSFLTGRKWLEEIVTEFAKQT